MALGEGWDSTSIWNEATGETFGDALGRFEGLGSEYVEPATALALIKAGFEVWSFGYGDDPEDFTCVDIDDVEVFEEDVEDAANMWGPFRFDAELGSSRAAVRFLLGFVEDWTMSPFLDDVSKSVLLDGLAALRDAGIGPDAPRTQILGTSPVSSGREEG